MLRKSPYIEENYYKLGQLQDQAPVDVQGLPIQNYQKKNASNYSAFSETQQMLIQNERAKQLEINQINNISCNWCYNVQNQVQGECVACQRKICKNCVQICNRCMQYSCPLCRNLIYSIQDSEVCDKCIQDLQ